MLIYIGCLISFLSGCKSILNPSISLLFFNQDFSVSVLFTSNPSMAISQSASIIYQFIDRYYFFNILSRFVASELAADIVINVGDVKFYLHKVLAPLF